MNTLPEGVKFKGFSKFIVGEIIAESPDEIPASVGWCTICVTLYVSNAVSFVLHMFRRVKDHHNMACSEENLN